MAADFLGGGWVIITLLLYLSKILKLPVLFLKTLSLYFHTARYYKIEQVWFRIFFSLKKSIRNKMNVQEKLQKQMQQQLAGHDLTRLAEYRLYQFDINRSLKTEDFYETIIKTTQEVVDHREFTFLNVKAKITRGIDFSGPYPSKLWGYNLNYFDVLIPISIYVNAEYDAFKAGQIENLVNEWIDTYDFKHPVLSAPYVVSLRLINFLYCLLLTNHLTNHQPPNLNPQKIIKYLYLDFLYLAKNLEWDIKGNHLVKNLKALLILGYFLNTDYSVQLAREAGQILSRQLKEQIFPDGGHFERSTMYQVIVTQDLIEIICFLRLFKVPVPGIFAEKLKAMLAFLEVVTHPDGEISLFNDSAFKIAPKASDILFAGALQLMLEPSPYARPGIFSYLWSGCSSSAQVEPLTFNREQRFDARPFTGYFALGNPSGKMIFDAGDLAPDYLPAHAHNDMLSFELSINQQRCIVDTGVFNYEPGPNRDRCRSTLSHNTVAINGAEQSETWASFRMARRSRIIGCYWQEEHDLDFVSAVRSQYTDKTAFHQRTVYSHPDGFWLIADQVGASGKSPHLSHLHFNPGLNPLLRLDVVEVGPLTIILYSLEQDHAVKIIDSVYFPEFGVVQERKSLCFCTRSTHFGYVIAAYPIENYEIMLELAKDTVRRDTIHLVLNQKAYNLKIPGFPKG